jgi:molybdenum-dependent DNA-binding transcriptional regulator ModE
MMKEIEMQLDTVEIVRGRLADGRTIADSDVHKLVAEIDRLRKALERAADTLSDASLLDAWADARAALGKDRQ